MRVRMFGTDEEREVDETTGNRLIARGEAKRIRAGAPEATSPEGHGITAIEPAAEAPEIPAFLPTPPTEAQTSDAPAAEPDQDAPAVTPEAESAPSPFSGRRPR